MKSVIEDRDNEIESLKKTIELLKNKGEVNRLNGVLKKEIEELSKWIEDHQYEGAKIEELVWIFC